MRARGDADGALRIEGATGLALGDRERQEDAVLCDVPPDGGTAIAVLADGLGGHVAGALASRLAVTTAMQHIAARRRPGGGLDGPVPDLLSGAVHAANAALAETIRARPEVAGMGTTIVAAAIEHGALYWASVGDSLLMLGRGGRLRQLNEVHSLARHLDLLASIGEIAPEEAAHHPGRSCLTSALGGAAVERVDCPDAPIPLMAGDVVLLASDGLLTLSEARMAEALAQGDRDPGIGAREVAEGAAALLDAVAEAGAEGQDNTAVALLRTLPARPQAMARPLALGRAAAVALARPVMALGSRRRRAGTAAGEPARGAAGHG